MFRLKFVLALVVLILAQDIFSKSIKKKHSKKQSIPSQKSHKSHYLLLMGSPVEDEHNRKGLGMILSSKLREEPDQLKDRPSKGAIHHSSKPDSDLAETLQTSSKANPPDHGYSYTEALFTGAPLLNGRPFTESDRTQGQSVGHDNDGNPVIEHDKTANDYKNKHADKSVGHTKEDESVQIQKEIHTEVGVSGFTVPMKESKSFQQFPSAKTEGEERKNSQNYDSHQYLIPQPSLNISPYKSTSESLGNKEYTHTHKVADSSSQGHNNIPSLGAAHNHFRHEKKSTKITITDPPAEQVHQILVTGKTQENFSTNLDRSAGPLVEEKKSNNELPDKTSIKSYDEESNLVGSSFYNKGQAEGKQFERTGGTQLHEFHTNDLNEPTDHGKTYDLQTVESFHKPGMDVSSKLGDQNIQSQREYFQTAAESENSKTDVSYEQRGRQPLYQNHVQPLESNVDSANEPKNVNDIIASADPNSRATYATYVGIKLPIKNVNASMTLPSESDRSDKEHLGTVNDVNQLRMHKIIESAFDEDLVQRIRLRPWSKQGSHRVPIQHSEDRQAEVGSHTSSDNTISSEKSEEQSSSNMTPPSLPFREGSNPAEFSHENEQSIEASSEAARTESLNRNQNEEVTQQDTSQQIPSESEEGARSGNENTAFTNDSNSQKEGSQNGVAYGPVTNDVSSDNSIKSSGDIPNQTEAYGEMKSSSSYREGSNPQTFGHQKEEPTSNGEEQPVEASSSSAEAATGAPSSSSSQMEAARQQDSSNELSSTDTINGAGSNQDQQQMEQENETNTGASDMSNQRETSQEISSSFSYREGSDPKMFSRQNGKLRAEQEQEQSAEALSPSSDTARVGPSGSSNVGTKTQSDKSDDMFSSNAVDTRPVQEDTLTQGASLHQEEQGETFQSNTENGLEGNNRPSVSSSNSLGPDVSGYNAHQVKVGIPEVATEMHQEDNSNARNEEQQLMPFYGIKNNSGRTSAAEPGNQQRENDHDNKNQKIVYFLKMAKGIPLLNSRRKVHNSDEGHRVGEHSKNRVANDVQGVDSTPQTGPEVSGRRRYPWRWQYKPRRPAWRPRPRPRQRPRPSYRPNPQPSPYPSPSTGGGGGALGGSSVDTNVPQGDSDFEQEALNTHNKYRKTHGVQDMTLSRDLSNQAKAYAQKIANMGQLLHSSQAERGESVGENLAYACSSNGTPLTGESATKMWYDEVCKPGYNFASGGFSSGTGHFTQVVWKDSIKLGIGQGKATQNGMQCIYVVGRYEIAGNMMGEFQDQVLRGNFNQAYCNNVKK